MKNSPDKSFLIFMPISNLQIGIRVAILFVTLVFFSSCMHAAPRSNPLLYVGKDGHLKYIKDEQGNRIPDFSYCGYEASEKAIPQVAAKVVVPSD